MREFFTANEGLRDGNQQLLFGGVAIRAILEQAVVVGVTATKLPTTALTSRHTLFIQNLSANMVYIGTSAVTTASGVRILPAGSMLIQISDTVDIYAIASAAGSDCRILECS